MNNFNTWRLCQIDRCGIEYGFQANVLKTNVAYVLPALTAIGSTPPAIEGEPALTAASFATHCLEAEKQRNKEIHMLKLSMSKFFATLWDAMSIESKEEVSHAAKFVQADTLRDPNMLLAIIRETHLTAIHGVGLGPLEIASSVNFDRNLARLLESSRKSSMCSMKRSVVPVSQLLQNRSLPYYF